MHRNCYSSMLSMDNWTALRGVKILRQKLSTFEKKILHLGWRKFWNLLVWYVLNCTFETEIIHFWENNPPPWLEEILKFTSLIRLKLNFWDINHSLLRRKSSTMIGENFEIYSCNVLNCTFEKKIIQYGWKNLKYTRAMP